MAIDTAAKRFSMMGLVAPHIDVNVIELDSAVDESDRLHFLGIYRGFDAGPPAPSSNNGFALVRDVVKDVYYDLARDVVS
jgi:hypothetical protein